jgi:hypothetical protein
MIASLGLSGDCSSWVGFLRNLKETTPERATGCASARAHGPRGTPYGCGRSLARYGEAHSLAIECPAQRVPRIARMSPPYLRINLGRI